MINEYEYADVCGNGESGNARFYAPLSVTSTHQQNQFDSASPPSNPLFSHLSLFPSLSHPTYSLSSLFGTSQPPRTTSMPTTQLGLVLDHQRLDRQRLQAQQQQQQQVQPEQMQPKKPQFADYETRLKSFDDPRWPSDCPVSPSELAEAGFYYYGKFTLHHTLPEDRFNLENLFSGEIQGPDRYYYDAVECFFCGKGICRWVPGDTAWSEHRRVSPGCLFVNDLKNRIKRGEIKTEPTSTSSSSQCSSASASDDEGYSSQNSQDRLQCKVCLQREISVTFLPCSHCVSCIGCAVYLKKCPICREAIAMSIRSFHA